MCYWSCCMWFGVCDNAVLCVCHHRNPLCAGIRIRAGHICNRHQSTYLLSLSAPLLLLLLLLQSQQCSLSVASNGDVIASVPTAAAVAASSATSSAAAAKAESRAAAAAFELKGSGWQAVVQQQGTKSIRVLQEDEFNAEVGERSSRQSTNTQALDQLCTQVVAVKACNLHNQGRPWPTASPPCATPLHTIETTRHALHPFLVVCRWLVPRPATLPSSGRSCQTGSWSPAQSPCPLAHSKQS